jgi:hypothetical protein
MQASADQFAAALRYQESIANINRAAVEAAIDCFDHSDIGGEARFAPEAVAMGIASLRMLLIPFVIYATDLECLNATGASVAERG